MTKINESYHTHADAGISMTGSIVSALNQWAEVRLVTLDIKGAFDSVWWRGLLCHIMQIDVGGPAYQMLHLIYLKVLCTWPLQRGGLLC